MLPKALWVILMVRGDREASPGAPKPRWLPAQPSLKGSAPSQVGGAPAQPASRFLWPRRVPSIPHAIFKPFTEMISSEASQVVGERKEQYD